MPLQHHQELFSQNLLFLQQNHCKKIKHLFFETHYYSLKSFNENGVVSLKELSKQIGKAESTIRKWVENDLCDRFRIVKGNVEEISKSEK